jgi:hypothetical protein
MPRVEHSSLSPRHHMVAAYMPRKSLTRPRAITARTATGHSQCIPMVRTVVTGISKRLAGSAIIPANWAPIAAPSPLRGRCIPDTQRHLGPAGGYEDTRRGSWLGVRPRHVSRQRRAIRARAERRRRASAEPLMWMQAPASDRGRPSIGAGRRRAEERNDGTAQPRPQIIGIPVG